MTVSDSIQLLAFLVPAIAGAVYAAVRLAIRAEVAAMELRAEEKFVTKTTCRAIRDACAELRCAQAKEAK